MKEYLMSFTWNVIISFFLIVIGYILEVLLYFPYVLYLGFIWLTLLFIVVMIGATYSAVKRWRK